MQYNRDSSIIRTADCASEEALSQTVLSHQHKGSSTVMPESYSGITSQSLAGSVSPQQNINTIIAATGKQNNIQTNNGHATFITPAGNHIRVAVCSKSYGDILTELKFPPATHGLKGEMNGSEIYLKLGSHVPKKLWNQSPVFTIVEKPYTLIAPTQVAETTVPSLILGRFDIDIKSDGIVFGDFSEPAIKVDHAPAIKVDLPWNKVVSSRKLTSTPFVKAKPNIKSNVVTHLKEDIEAKRIEREERDELIKMKKERADEIALLKVLSEMCPPNKVAETIAKINYERHSGSRQFFFNFVATGKDFNIDGKIWSIEKFLSKQNYSIVATAARELFPPELDINVQFRYVQDKVEPKKYTGRYCLKVTLAPQSMHHTISDLPIMMRVKTTKR